MYGPVQLSAEGRYGARKRLWHCSLYASSMQILGPQRRQDGRQETPDLRRLQAEFRHNARRLRLINSGLPRCPIGGRTGCRCGAPVAETNRCAASYPVRRRISCSVSTALSHPRLLPKREPLLRFKVRQDPASARSLTRSSRLWYGSLAKCVFPLPGKLDEDCLDFRAELFLPAPKSGRSRPAWGTQRSRLCRDFWRRRVLQDPNAFRPGVTETPGRAGAR